MKLGQVAYEAYCKATGGVSLISGVKLAEFDGLPQNIQNAWMCAAQSVKEQIKKDRKGD